jgi:NH3-dependent NAD+ synthetase
VFKTRVYELAQEINREVIGALAEKRGPREPAGHRAEETESAKPRGPVSVKAAAKAQVIPERSITKEPSAELRPDQRDQDSLPPYALLDGLLEDFLEKNLPVSELARRWVGAPGVAEAGLASDWVARVLRLVEQNEYKRRQAPPALKVGPKAFGLGRRVPVAKRWRAWEWAIPVESSQNRR